MSLSPASRITNLSKTKELIVQTLIYSQLVRSVDDKLLLSISTRNGKQEAVWENKLYLADTMPCAVKIAGWVWSNPHPQLQLLFMEAFVCVE